MKLELYIITIFITICLIIGCATDRYGGVYNKGPKYVLQDGIVHEVVCNGQNCRLVPRPDLKEIPK